MSPRFTTHPRLRRFFERLVLVGLCLARPAFLPALELHRERSSLGDLALTGRITGVPAGETRYVRWADLRKLPTTKLSPHGEFLTGAQALTVVFLRDLWNALPRSAGADVFLATCNDGYASVYRAELMAEHQPFLILEIDGYPNERWPAPGMKSNPGPYAIWVSASVAPAVGQLLDPGHKCPWGVTTLEVASFAERFHGAYSGRWANLSSRAAAGREIWINSCASCHPGPGDIFGGAKGGLPYAVIAAHATARADFFRQYIRTPKSIRPDAKMDAHPHYTDAHVAELIAFIAAEPSPVTVQVEPMPSDPVARTIRNRDDLVELVTTTLKAWESNDASRFLAAFAADAVFAYPGGRIGKDALAVMFADLHARKTDIKIYLGSFIVAGNEFAVRYQFACTDRFSGKRQAVGTGVRGTLRDGRIVKFKEYWDAHIPAEQMAGTLPLDEGDANSPAPRSLMLDPKRVN